MLSEYISLNDPRVIFRIPLRRAKFSRMGATITEQQPYRCTVNTIGAHREPRMPSVMTPIRTFNMGPADFAEISVRDTPLNGVNNVPPIF